MSIKLMSQVYDRRVSHAEQSVLLAMADHAKDDGTRCYPSVPLLAWKTGYSERQIQRIMAGLRARKALVLTAKATQHRSAEYRIDLSVLPEKPAFRGDILSSGENSRGDILGAPGVTPRSLRGDAAMSPEPSEPSLEPLRADTNVSGGGEHHAPPPPHAPSPNGSTQEPSPAVLPAQNPVNGKVGAGALPADLEPVTALPAQAPRSARNGNGKANGKAPKADADPERAAELKAVFGELCEWLGLDWQKLPPNTRGRLNKTAGGIVDAGLAAETVKRARLNWSGDWRGKNGQKPTLGQAEDLIAQAGAVPATTNFDEVW